MDIHVLHNGRKRSGSSITYLATYLYNEHFVPQILSNKAILSIWHFQFPFFLTGWHMFFGMVLTQLLSRTTKLLPGVKEVSTIRSDEVHNFGKTDPKFWDIIIIKFCYYQCGEFHLSIHSIKPVGTISIPTVSQLIMFLSTHRAK